jgi:hypothetical protein
VSRTCSRRLFAGEDVLEAALRAAGVRVVHPEALPLERQVEEVRNAETAIFAEGSALHLLQLGGADFEHVIVVNRRPGARLADHLLAPRCRELVYLDAVAATVTGHHGNGMRRGTGALGLADPERLIEGFAALGVDLRGRLDPRAFRRAAGRDLTEYATRLTAADFGRGRRSVAALARDMAATGLPGRRRAAATAAARWMRAAAGRRLARFSSSRSGRRGS